jgi:ribonuclease HI
MILEITTDTNYSKIIIFIDNQVVLKALTNLSRPLDQYIIFKIIKHLNQLQVDRRIVELYWVPVYREIKGNKRVDIVVREATEWKRTKKKNGK